MYQRWPVQKIVPDLESVGIRACWAIFCSTIGLVHLIVQQGCATLKFNYLFTWIFFSYYGFKGASFIFEDPSFAAVGGKQRSELVFGNLEAVQSSPESWTWQ